MGSRFAPALLLSLAFVLTPGLGPAAMAQAPAPPASTAPSPGAAAAAITGVVSERHSAARIPGATVTLEETGRTVVSGPDGTYRFDDVAPGIYHLRATLDSFTPARV